MIMDQKYNILITDDDVDIREALKYALEKAGYEVTLADSIHACHNQLFINIPDILLLDVVLPDGDGIELALELSKDQNYVSMGILLMSGLKTDKKTKEKGITNGALYFCNKPVQIDDLLEKLKLIFKVRELEGRNKSLEEQYDYMFSNAHDILILLDKQGKITSLSKSFETISGLKIRDQLNKPFEELISPEYRSEWKKNIDQLLNQSVVPTFETFLVNVFKNVVPIEVQMTASASSDGKGTVIIGIAKDMRVYHMMASEKADTQMEPLKEQQNELQSWEAMSTMSANKTTETYGLSVLQDNNTDVFKNMVKAYHSLIDKAVEQRIYKHKHVDRREHQMFANELGFMKAGPRDLIRIHTHLFKSLFQKINPKKMAIYHEEARLVLLSIMGYLVSFYKNNNTSSL